MSIELKTKETQYGIFIYAIDENGVRYNITPLDSDDECAGVLLDSLEGKEPNELFKITHTKTLNPQ